jgi:hypothetical protein
LIIEGSDFESTGFYLKQIKEHKETLFNLKEQLNSVSEAYRQAGLRAIKRTQKQKESGE